MGRKVIYELNRLGILVYLSHTSADTMRDVLRGDARTEQSDSESSGQLWTGSLAPPIFSHTNAFAVFPHPRNVPDDALHLLADRQGLVMVTFSPDFVSCHWPDGEPIPGQLPDRYDRI